MPVYTYRCNNSKCHVLMFETVLSFDEFMRDKKVKCPKCNHKTNNRVIAYPPRISFKGKGFYSTDNPKEDKNE